MENTVPNPLGSKRKRSQTNKRKSCKKLKIEKNANWTLFLFNMEFTNNDNDSSKGPKYIKALLDRSGSMVVKGLYKALVEGVNTLISEQKNTAELYGTNPIIDIYTFDVFVDHIRSSSIKEVTNISDNEVYPRGSTALNDSIGKVLEESKDQSDVLFFIFTDGSENTSKKFKGNAGLEKIKEMMKDYTDNKNWTVIFGAANINAAQTSKNYGISPNNAFDVLPEAKSVSGILRAVSNQVTNSARSGEDIDFDVIRQASQNIDEEKILSPPNSVVRAFNSNA